MRYNMISDRSGFQALQDHPAVMTCLPITERFKRMSGLQHFRKFWKLRRTDIRRWKHFNDSTVLKSCLFIFFVIEEKEVSRHILKISVYLNVIALIHCSKTLKATQHPISFILLLPYAKTHRQQPFRCQTLRVMISQIFIFLRQTF